MQLANYISDLLYRYDCVIVPNFGGFITNKIGATVNNYTHTFYPPTKQISFNKNLQHNDGLLANYIASAENISFEKANEAITQCVTTWQNELKIASVTIASVGILSLNDNEQLTFEPNTKSNFLTESFGLATVHSSAIERYKEEVKTLTPTIENEEANKRTFILPAFAKYAATGAILLTLGTIGYNNLNADKQQKIIAKQQKDTEQKIQQATFVIDTPLPTINLTVKKENTAKYHVIAGAFEFSENAEKKLVQLKAKGFKNARIIGKNKWGLTQVTYTSVSDKNEALSVLQSIKNTASKDAWLLVKKLD